MGEGTRRQRPAIESPAANATEAFPYREEQARGINRRGLLRTAMAGVVAVAGGEWLAVRSPQDAVSETIEAPLAALAVGASVAVRSAQATDVLIVRVDADNVVAFDRKCPHLGCPVLWSAERVRFECPCHRASFDARSGAVLEGPPRRGLTPISMSADTRARLAGAAASSGNQLRKEKESA